MCGADEPFLHLDTVNHCHLYYHPPPHHPHYADYIPVHTGVWRRQALPAPRRGGAGTPALSAAGSGPLPPRQEDGGPRVQPDLPGPAAGRIYVCVWGGVGGRWGVCLPPRQEDGWPGVQPDLPGPAAGRMCVCVCGGVGEVGGVCVPPRQEDGGPGVQPDLPGPAAGSMCVCVCGGGVCVCSAAPGRWGARSSARLTWTSCR